jgi:hypothetical protein
MKEQVADRLIAEFPDQLKGVVLVEARVDTNRDREFFAAPHQVLVGAGEIYNYIPSADREVRVLPGSTSWVGSELIDSVTQELVACIGHEKVLEIFSSQDNSITNVLRSISPNLKSLGEDAFDNGGTLLLNDKDYMSAEVSLQESSNLTNLSAPVPAIDIADRLVPPNKAAKIPHLFDGTVVLSFPHNEKGKAEIKGVTSKKFRHWLGNVVRPKRIVMVTESWDGIRKDIGHMKLVGYELRLIKAFDTQPGRMDKILIVAMMDLRPSYQPLLDEQLIP